MKILFVAPRFHTNLYFPLKALIQKGHDVRLAVSYVGKIEYHDFATPEILGYSVLFTLTDKLIGRFTDRRIKGIWGLSFALPSIRKLWKLLSSYRPDVIILKDHLSLLVLSVTFFARLLSIPTIILTQTSKNHIIGSHFLLKFYLLVLKLNGVNAFMTPTLRTKVALESIGVRNVHYVPFVVETEEFEKEYVSHGIIRLLSIGKFIQRKDHLILLKALSALKTKYPLKLTLIGERVDEDYLIECLAFIKENHLEEDVSIQYELPFESIRTVYREHDIFILPSYDEPAAVSLVEAMSHKLPVIVSTDCGTNCYVTPGVNGFIFEARTLGDLIDKVEKFCADSSTIKQMGKNAFDMSKTIHNPSVFIQAIESIVSKK